MLNKIDKVLGLFTLIGSIIGIIITLILTVTQIVKGLTVLNLLLFLIFIAYYLIGILLALSYLKKPSKRLNAMAVFYGLQLPIILTKQFIYSLFTGLMFGIQLNILPGDFSLKFLFSIGAKFNFYINTTYNLTSIGINFVPILIIIYCLKRKSLK